MRYAILADIHGNLDALAAVLNDLSPGEADACLCLGDIVGYGAQPDECVARIIEIGALAVAGNHDYASIGMTSTSNFNEDARNSVLWTREHLSEAHKAYLLDLPLVRVQDGVSLVHSSLYCPESFTYIMDEFDAALCYERMNTPVCFVGHSHVPMQIVFDRAGQPEPVFLGERRLADEEAALLNVGSVGQPRDGDPRAAYALYDDETRSFELRRIEYPIDSAVRKILDAGLPGLNAYRLQMGR